MSIMISKTKRFFYILVFAIGFGPVLVVLTMGVIFSPLFMLSIFEGSWQNIFMVSLIVLGLFGFWGALSLLGIMLYPKQENTNPQRLKGYIMAGVIATTTASVFATTANVYLIPIFLAPLLLTLHLSIKLRHYFIASTCNAELTRD